MKVMLMGMGSLTGIAKLEVYAWYAVIFNLVNFIVYMTFFPAGLSLILELMYCHDGRPRWNVKVRTTQGSMKFDNFSSSPFLFLLRRRSSKLCHLKSQLPQWFIR